MLLRETATRARHLPVWETLCCGALVLAAAGTEEQQRALLPGDRVGAEPAVTPALREVGRALTDGATTTFHDGTVTGRKVAVTLAARGEPAPGHHAWTATGRSWPWSTPATRA